MTKRTAYIISALAVILGLTFSVYDMHSHADDSTAKILRSCGINPWTGGSLD